LLSAKIAGQDLLPFRLPSSSKLPNILSPAAIFPLATWRPTWPGCSWEWQLPLLGEVFGMALANALKINPLFGFWLGDMLLGAVLLRL